MSGYVGSELVEPGGLVLDGFSCPLLPAPLCFRDKCARLALSNWSDPRRNYFPRNEPVFAFNCLSLSKKKKKKKSIRELRLTKASTRYANICICRNNWSCCSFIISRLLPARFTRVEHESVKSAKEMSLVMKFVLYLGDRQVYLSIPKRSIMSAAWNLGILFFIESSGKRRQMRYYK